MIAFDGDPRWQAAYAANASHVTFLPYAVGTQNGTARMHQSTKGDQATTFAPTSARKHARAHDASAGTLVRVIDLSDWLRVHVRPSDYVVCKIDIEREEFRLLPHLIERGTYAQHHTYERGSSRARERRESPLRTALLADTSARTHAPVAPAAACMIACVLYVLASIARPTGTWLGDLIDGLSPRALSVPWQGAPLR